MVVFLRGAGRGAGGGPKNHKGRGTVRGVRGPSAPPVPEAPLVVARAPSEPQGPSLPAGPPELLLRVEADVVRHGSGSLHERLGRCNLFTRTATYLVPKGSTPTFS